MFNFDLVTSKAFELIKADLLLFIPMPLGSNTSYFYG